MKKQVLSIGLIITLLLYTSILLFGQAPQGFNYQAVARDMSGDLLKGQSLTVRIGILHDEALIWQEVHVITTNSLGAHPQSK